MNPHLKRKLTRHGRERFIERVGFLNDDEILTVASLPSDKYKFIWKLVMIKKKYVYHLITVLVKGE